jgi:hypothetical protein
MGAVMITPIETIYKGYRFRSRLEARWAVFMDACGADWEYEPEGISAVSCAAPGSDLDEEGNAIREYPAQTFSTYYLPDFVVHNVKHVHLGRGESEPCYEPDYGDVYIEVKGKPTLDDVLKIKGIVLGSFMDEIEFQDWELLADISYDYTHDRESDWCQKYDDERVKLLMVGPLDFNHRCINASSFFDTFAEYMPEALPDGTDWTDWPDNPEYSLYNGCFLDPLTYGLNRNRYEIIYGPVFAFPGVTVKGEFAIFTTDTRDVSNIGLLMDTRRTYRAILAHKQARFEHGESGARSVKEG